MKASIVDLRYKMKRVLKALRRKEAVHILYHGKEAGIILPSKATKTTSILSHPFFGMSKKESNQKSVEKEMDQLRGTRYHAS